MQRLNQFLEEILKEKGSLDIDGNTLILGL